MLARSLPEVIAVVDDTTLPDPVRFVVARFAEALDPTSPIHRRAISHCDPRAIVRDLTAAIRLHDAAGGTGHEWKLLLARLGRVRQLLGFDIALRRHWPDHTETLRNALRGAPNQPRRDQHRQALADWRASARVPVLQAAVALRRALNDERGGYRRTLTGIVARTTTTELHSAEAKRRADERIGLLAAMLIDEGQDACTVMRRVAIAAQEPASRRAPAVSKALWSRPRSHEVLIAATGVAPWPHLDTAVRVHELESALSELRPNWPEPQLDHFIDAARVRNATAIVSVRTRGRDAAHAVRAARTTGRDLVVHQATRSLFRRPELLDVALVRRKGDQQATMVHRPTWHTAIGPPEPHEATTAFGALRYGARAATAESDVARVLDSWIAFESLTLGRPGAFAGTVICHELPDLVWHLAIRDVLLAPLLMLRAEPSRAGQVILEHLETGNQEERWLDVLAGDAPAVVGEALDHHAEQLDPLRRWRLDEARNLLRNGKLLARRVDRHRTQVEWLVRRLREQRNAIAHQAVGDQPFTSPQRSYDTDASLPTDARVLGALGVALLATVGELASSVLLPGSTTTSPQSMLAAASSRHQRTRSWIQQTQHGQRTLRRPPHRL